MQVLIVNVWGEQTLSENPTFPTPPVLAKVSEAVGEPYGGAMATVNRLIRRVGITNVLWLVLLILWTAVIVSVHCSLRLGKTFRPCVTDFAGKMESAIERHPIAQLKSLIEPNSENDQRSLINSETGFELKTSV
jgi:hypothetical protein